MSGLKSAWELSLEKTDKMNPETKKKLTDRQKKQISEIRKELQAQIADKEITLQHKLSKLADRLPPEQVASSAEEMKKKFVEEKQFLEAEMERKIEDIHKQKS